MDKAHFRIYTYYKPVLWGYAGRIYRKLTGNELIRKVWAGQQLLSRKEMNAHIKELLDSGKPMMVSRFGAMEMENIVQSLEKAFGIRESITESCRHALYNNAGFFPFPTDEDVSRFTKIYQDAFQEVDVLGCWYLRGEEYMIREYGADNLRLSRLGDLEPWKYPSAPWSEALKGKKVLFIHPFKDTILVQAPKWKQIFPGTAILPEMDVKLLRAVQTIAGTKDERFENWFEALQWMFKEAMKIDFDVAIIGCGAYGMPLASMIKKSGKQAIHLGGATQLFWGIRGARWDENAEFKPLFNDAWIRPLPSDCVTNREKVEDGCYW